ncbi:unnamed protein product, partial [marine sediment metagenome]
MSPRQLAHLDRGERRVAYARLGVRVAAIATMLLIAYYTLPAGWLEGGTGTGILRLVSSGLFFVVVLAWLVRRITMADLPQLRAIEVLAAILPLFLYVFANTYLAMSHASVDAFSEPLNHTGALYLAITLLSTVGFGDITPG